MLTLVLATGAPAQSPHATSAARGLRFTVGIAEPAPGTLRGFAGAPVDGAGTRHREPIVAGVLGVLPGLGHAYAGEPRRGLVVFGVWFGSTALAFSGRGHEVANAAGIMMLGSHVFSIADAALAAGRFNRRHATPPRAATDSTSRDE